MLGEQLPFEDMTWLLGREAMLQPASLCLENFDCLLAEDSKYKSQLRSLREVIQTFSRLTFLIGCRPWNPHGFLGECVFFDVEFPIPDDRERIHLWESHLSSHYRLAEDLDLGALASRFRFTPGQIQDALVDAQNLTRLRPYDDRITMADLYSACRAQSNQKLSTLARKIELKYAWDDIVLPSDQMKQLREICNQAKYRHIVYGEWGFDRKLSLGKGLNVLFSGPSGTGKTMAARLLLTNSTRPLQD
jgi:hypothetical protein